MAKKFVHLHVHTEYSLLDGLPKINDLLARTKELKMDSIAITDHGVMYGAIEFYKKALKEGIKPIIGMEGYIVDGSHKKKEVKAKSQNYHLLLLAKNKKGYQNLMTLSSIAHIEGFYYRPRFGHETLKKYSEGIICTSACGKGEIGQALIDDDYENALSKAKWYQNVFGKDYYLELQRHFWAEFAKKAENEEIKKELLTMDEAGKKINEGIMKISRELGIAVVATNDVHYVEKDDAAAQDALVCISTGKNVSDIKRMRYIDMPDLYLKSAQEMSQVFSDIPESIENSLKIAKECKVEITLGEWFFPKIKLSKGVSAEKELKLKVSKGLGEKYKKITKNLQKRAQYELKVIIDKGYAPYFLIYEDMASWSKNRKIPINTRGSVAGSIVSYSLGITSVDPIKYMLPFERFLNPFRPSAPDIDLDIADDKREEMIAYLVNKYGKDKVAQICTFGRMLARGSVRDVARVLGYPYDTGDKISKLIPIGSQGFPMTIDRALDESIDLRNLYNSDKDAKRILDFAKQIEGNARHISVHAAGIVISPEKLTLFSPVQLEPSGEKVITQYEMHSCEDIGLVKLDVLGIRNLSILREAVQLVGEVQGINIDLSSIPLDDKKTYEMLSSGETMGTFQLSGSGMTRFIKQLQPERIEDIMAMIALFRPGPMANIPEYIARKKGEKKVKYYHPKMEKFLDKSFGILVYQDDLLFTAMEIAGYDWKSVDKFRKAVGKKIPEEMARQHKIFVKGCVKYSKITKKEAEGLWDLFEPFQGYGFNKAHAASYGMVAYQTAYMKANYPVEFMCALLTAESNDTDKVSAAVNECKRMEIDVLAPNINKSGVSFKIESHGGEKVILFGLEAIKNVGKAAIEAILSAREEGPFKNYADFLSRVDSRRVNKKVIESLIKVGALSDFGNRASLLASMDEIRNKVVRPKTPNNQQGLFTKEEIKKSTSENVNKIGLNIEEFDDEEIQALERQLLGFSLSAKPISELISSLKSYATHDVEEVFQEEEKKDVKLAVLVEEIRVVVTKSSGQEMAFVRVKDESGSLNLVVFPKIFRETRQYWTDKKPLLVTGKVNLRDDEASIIVDAVEDNGPSSEKKESLYIRIPKGATKSHLHSLKKLLLDNPGEQSVCLIFEENQYKKVQLAIKVSWNKQVAQQISDALNSEPN